MKILVQVVKEANVSIKGQILSSINEGYLLYVSFTHEDNFEIIDKMIEKLCKIRIFSDENGKTNLSIFDVNGEILSISQFTLYGSLKKTNRPSFINSLSFDKAKQFYEYFNLKLGEKINVKVGAFGEDMQIYSINNGPFTIMMDDKEIFS